MGNRKSTLESVGLMNLKRIFSETFKKRTVLITGHTGFKGAWLTLWLESLGANVIGYSLDPPTEPSFFHETGLSDRITDIRGDISDQEHIFKVIEEYKPGFIFHLAAQPLVRSSYKNPVDTFRINIMGTATVLEAIRISERPSVCICITSDKCYENREWDYAYRENDPMGGHDPYSASKGAAELVIAAYRRSFFSRNNQGPTCSVASARAGNIIGGGDWAEDRLVPDCVRALATGEKIRIRNPTAVRPWQFVLDPLSGYLWLAAKMKEDPRLYADAWNFGPCYANNVNVKTLTELLIHQWGSGEWEDVSQPDDHSVHEAEYLKLDIAKAMTKLGWKPVYNLKNTLQKTVDWYKNYYHKKTDPDDFSLGQIDTYMQDANKK